MIIKFTSFVFLHLHILYKEHVTSQIITNGCVTYDTNLKITLIYTFGFFFFFHLSNLGPVVQYLVNYTLIGWLVNQRLKLTGSLTE